MGRGAPVERFGALAGLDGLVHGFVLRQPGVAVSCDREATLERLAPGFERALVADGLAAERVASAEQVHGAEVAVVGSPGSSAGADGLVTAVGGLALTIVVADCCAVFLVDPVRRVIGLVHSGRRGTERGIVARAVERMEAGFGTRSRDIVAQLSPCVRPPCYEVDIAARIRAQLVAAGVEDGQVWDSGVCTACDLGRYYSYRAERGDTGRMLAFLALDDGGGRGG